MTLPKISIVVIGYNESENLHKTFMAIKEIRYPQKNIELIYVDSGSTDNSVEIANEYTQNIFIEDKFPSPGRNRNRGLVEASHAIVHFIDGDVVIDKNYLYTIAPLFEEKSVHAIVGQLDEQNPNLYNKIAALSNVRKNEGYAKFTSTGATYIKSSLIAVNGYDERIRRGQESELGERFLKAGFKIWCTSQSMGSHNFGISKLSDYAKRYETDARTQFQLSLIEGNSTFFKQARKQIIKGFVKLAVFCLTVYLSLLYNFIWLFIGYLIVACLLRNKAYFKRYFMESPLLVIYRAIIDFFMIIFWWYGLFAEIYNFLIKKKHREFYALKKQVLNAKAFI